MGWDVVSWELLELHLHLTSKLSDDDWVMINCIAADKAFAHCFWAQSQAE
jgi:hypothetical protein